MDEWRKAARVGLVSEVQIQRIVPEAGEVVAWGADLSEGGIGLLANSPLQMGEEIALQISVPESADPILVKGLIVWTKATKPGLRVGVRFRGVEALAGARILQLIADRLARLSASPPAPSVTSHRPLRARRPLLTILWPWWR